MAMTKAETDIERPELPLVSIVVPAYNHANYLDDTIRSVLAQDYPNIELIVLDDGSTDATRQVLERYGTRFHWETHKNMGQANTLNKGWQMSKGKVLSYLSADDVLLPQAVSTSLQYLRDDVVMTYCDFNLIDAESKIIRSVAAPDFDYRQMFAQYVCQPGPGVFMTRQAFEQAGLWNSAYRQMPDYDYWLRLGMYGRFLRIPKVLAGFRVHEDSQTYASASEAKADEPVSIISGFISQQALPPILRGLKQEALANAYLVSSQLHLRAGRYWRGGSRVWRAVAIFPWVLLRARTWRVLFNSLFNRMLHKMVRFRNRRLSVSR